MSTALSIILSVAALAFSIFVFIDNRLRDRRDLLIKMHELLISDDLQKGRHLLFTKVSDHPSVEQLSGEDYRNINRALSAYSLLGIYVDKGYVNEQDVIDAWGWSIYRSWVAAQPFFDDRIQRSGTRPGKYLELLAKRVERSLGQDALLPDQSTTSRQSPP